MANRKEAIFGLEDNKGATCSMEILVLYSNSDSICCDMASGGVLEDELDNYRQPTEVFHR